MKEIANPKRGRGRPKTITDMREYKARKQREYRAKQKLERESDGRVATD